MSKLFITINLRKSSFLTKFHLRYKGRYVNKDLYARHANDGKYHYYRTYQGLSCMKSSTYLPEQLLYILFVAKAKSREMPFCHS